MASPAARSVDVRAAFLADGGPYEARFSQDACDASFEACRGRARTFGAWTFLKEVKATKPAELRIGQHTEEHEHSEPAWAHQN